MIWAPSFYFSSFLNLGVWILQASVGVIFIYHGWPKLKNKAPAFGIGGFVHGLVHGLIEFVGGIFLILGWYVRPVAFVFAIIMLGAIFFKKFKWKIPFSSQTTTGWEFDFILLAANMFLLFYW